VSPSPVATPSPTPLTAAAVLAKLSDPTFAYSADVTGTLVVGPLSLNVTGSRQYAAGDSYSLVIVDVPNAPQRSETTNVGGRTYTRASEGSPWFEAPASGSSDNLASAILKTGALTDKGVATRSGKQVHRFGTASGSLAATDLGVTTPGITDFGGTLDLYADDTGNLVAIGVAATWQQPTPSAGSVPTSMTLDFAVTGVKPSIVAPSDVWTRFTSTRWAYTIGYPSTVTPVAATKANDPDVFAFSASEYYVVVRELQPKGVKLADYVKAYIVATSTQYKVKPESQSDITVDGRPGVLLQYHIKFGGATRFNAVAMTLDGRQGYTIAIVTDPGSEADALSFLDLAVGTFAVTK
jgi:hypothetical protein